MIRQSMALCGVSAAALMLAAGPVQAQVAQAPVARGADSAAARGRDAQASTTVQELIVTAQKREESINDVPMSVSAASGETLNELGITDTSQLVKIVPGFNYTPSYYGTPVYSIRGVGFLDTSLAASPTVSVYVDEAPLPYSIMTQGASLDLERVEVLKGPQGTLFGMNATGGAINYVAGKPTEDLRAGVDASYGRFNTVDLQGFVSGPITPTLSGRLALRMIRSSDWQRSYTRNDSVGEQDFFNGRASLLWRPTDRFRALLTLSAWQDRGETQMGQLFGFAPLNPVNGVDPRILAYPLAPHNARSADWGACVNTSPLDPPFDQTQPPFGYNPPRPLNSTVCTGFQKDNTFYSGNLRVDYDLSEDITLTTLVGHARFDRYQPIEGDGIIYQDYESLQRGHIASTFVEARLSGTFGGRGNWIVGGNYQHDDTWDNFLQTYGGSSAVPVFGLRLGPTRPVNDQTTKTAAVFGNAEFPITEQLSVQAGIRYTDSRKDFFGCGTDGGDGTWSLISQQIQNFLAFVNGLPPAGVDVGPTGCATTGPPPTFNPAAFTDELDEDNISWRAGVNFRPNEATLLYANVSQGYKSGSFPTVATSAFSQLAPATQEKLVAYEVGFKAGLADGTLQLNGAAFYYDYKDKQILGALNDPIFGALPALVNVPNSNVKGFELQVAWQPVEGLNIRGGLSHSDSKIEGTYFNFDAFAQLADFGGEPFPAAPKWHADADVEYTWPIAEGMNAFAGANVTYQSFTRSFFYNREPTSIQPPSVLNLPERALLDLRAGVDADAWRVQAWVRNATNKYYWVNAVHVNDVLLRYAGMPRTYGVTFTYRFE
jgi:iron complex outermembrane receptor protein